MTKDKLKKIFEKYLHEIRKEKGLTQEKLAEKANLNEKYYGRIERGESIPTIIKLWNISEALEIPCWKLIYKIEKKAHKKK